MPGLPRCAQYVVRMALTHDGMSLKYVVLTCAWSTWFDRLRICWNGP